MPQAYDILWVDDQIAHYSEFSTALTQRGLRITPVDNVREANAKLRKKRFDLILLDLKMPELTGFDFLRLTRHRSNAPTCVLSSYLHLDEYQKKLNRVRLNVAVLDKDLPDPDTSAFEVFAEKLKEIIINPPKTSPANSQRNLVDSFEHADASEITFKEYLTLPNKIKKIIRESARDQAKDAMRREFNEGYIWLLFCGDLSEPVMRARDQGEIPSNDTIMTKAMELDRAPFQYTSPDSIDDIFSGACQGPSSFKNYPTVSLNVGGSEMELHFDTGSPYTFFSFEELNELGLVDASALPIDGSRGFFSYEFLNQNIRCKMRDQISSSSKFIQLNVRAVKGWNQCPFVVHCPPTCRNHNNRQEHQKCQNRTALVGRNIIFENRIAITICGASNRTSYKRVRKNGGGK